MARAVFSHRDSTKDITDRLQDMKGEWERVQKMCTTLQVFIEFYFTMSGGICEAMSTVV